MHRQRDYLFYGATRALCSICLHVVDAKELISGERVILWKRCPEHGIQEVLLSDDAAYYRRGREVYIKPPEQVAKYNTGFQYGCPYDCGICPDHEQHGCVSILEVTDHCNLRCPTCYASSGPERTTHRSLAQLEAMLDRIVSNEGEPDVVQVSGGEPTLHPQFFEILDACRKRPIRHLMLNTNGIRIAKEDGFAQRLATYAPHFEVYLQFDSLRPEVLKTLRGKDLLDVRLRALDKLDALNLSTTLVVTIRRGLNDDELGDIVRFAAQRTSVRGITLQPVQDAGRNEGFLEPMHRLTLSEVRRRLIEQTPELFTPDDVVPVPCHPECLAMAYALKQTLKGQPSTLTPLTRFVSPAALVESARNTIVVEDDKALVRKLFDTFSTAHGPESAAKTLGDLLCCLPKIEGAQPLRYDNVFRVVIMQFLDRHTMDLRSVRKSCVHIAHPDGKRVIPFDTYNVLYRDALEPEILQPLRMHVSGEGHGRRVLPIV
jgi:7,8-dihydro-6-hydroxymethylpterin dimethyltransferase